MFTIPSGFQVTRVLPPPPPGWSIDHGTAFAFPPVEKSCDRRYIVTTSLGRWNVTPLSDGGWRGRLIRHYTETPDQRVVDATTTADVIAAIFANYA